MSTMRGILQGAVCDFFFLKQSRNFIQIHSPSEEQARIKVHKGQKLVF